MSETMEDRNRIGRFLVGLYEVNEEAKLPDRLVIRHVSIGDRQNEVSAIALGATIPDEETLERLVTRVFEAVTADADGLGGSQRYFIVALREHQMLARLAVRLSGYDDLTCGGPFDSEPANAQGLLAQLMRHNETQTRMFTLSMGQIIQTMQRTISRLHQNAEESELKRRQYVELSEELTSRKSEREIEELKARAEIDSRQHIYAQLGRLLPLAASYMGLGKSAGSEPGATPALLRSLFATLTPDQLSSLEKLLTPEQMALLFRIHEGIGPEVAEGSRSLENTTVNDAGEKAEDEDDDGGQGGKEPK